MSYAEGTLVSSSRSRIEIEDLLRKAGASQIGVITEVFSVQVGFKIGQWAVRFRLPLPGEEEAKGVIRSGRSWRDPKPARIRAWIEKEERRRWRALLLTIKAKLVSVESKVETFEEAFLAHVVLPDSGGETIADAVLPALRAGHSPFKALPAGSAR